MKKQRISTNENEPQNNKNNNKKPLWRIYVEYNAKFSESFFSLSLSRLSVSFVWPIRMGINSHTNVYGNAKTSNRLNTFNPHAKQLTDSCFKLNANTMFYGVVLFSAMQKHRERQLRLNRCDDANRFPKERAHKLPVETGDLWSAQRTKSFGLLSSLWLLCARPASPRLVHFANWYATCFVYLNENAGVRMR